MPSPSRSSGTSTVQVTTQPGRKIPGQQIARPIYAAEHIRRMRGGAQSHLMRCSDGRYYVVKFLNNPQGPRVLANEFLGSRLAHLLRLPVAFSCIVNVDEDLIRYTDELVVEMPRKKLPCQAGLCFGSLYQGDPRYHTTENDLADSDFRVVANLDDFCGMLVFDLWTCNTDGRQVVFRLEMENYHYRAVMIDNGFCFNAGEWNFPDAPLRGLYRRSIVYENVLNMDAFEPWLTRVEQIDHEEMIATTAEGLPGSWYGSNTDSLEGLLSQLYRRRNRVRELLLSARNSSRNPFPNWIEQSVSSLAEGRSKIA
jgi:hypothetical protein